MRILILSTANSGSTILQYMLANSMENTQVFVEESAKNLRNLPKNCVAKIIFENQSEEEILHAAEHFDLKLLLVRDPRDTLLSSLLFLVANRPQALSDEVFLGKLFRSLRDKEALSDSVNLLSIAELFPDNSVLLKKIADAILKYADFVQTQAKSQAWQVVYYEDFIHGNLRRLQMSLGVTVAPVLLPEELSYLARSKNSGDWRNWYTQSDVTRLREYLSDPMKQLGYDQDWQLAQLPVIPPEHASEFVLRLVQKRRRYFDFPEWQENNADRGSVLEQFCTICNGGNFTKGPNGRLSSTGVLPHCEKCGSLERQRIVRSLFQALPLGFIDWRRGLQFSPDPGVCAEQFRSYEVSEYGGKNSIDMQAIDRVDASYDFISFNHVLEFVPDDLKSFSEMLRVLSPDGVIQACFSMSLSRNHSQDYSEPNGPFLAWHLYGTDLVERFSLKQRGVSMLVVEGADPCTGQREIVHFFCKNPLDVERISKWLHAWCPDIRVITNHTEQVL